MRAIIETNGYPTRIILVAENDADRLQMKELKFSFCDDSNSETITEYDDPDDVQDYGSGVLAISAYCNLT